jgi:PAS domain S-box-containing protein
MKKILIVDDKEENLYLLQSLLDESDFKVTTARNGAEALGLMKIEEPDLIITDILMPVMDGFTLCRECKKDEVLKNIPFFFYTATYTDSRDEEYALGLGADRFILKPQEPDELISIITGFFKKSKQKSFSPKEIIPLPENVVLKEYNEVLIRKLEDKMVQAEKTEKELRNYAEQLEREISERRKIEESLRESQILFQTLAEVSPVGIFRTSTDGSTTYVNPKWCELSGVPFDKALGGGWLDAVHPDDKGILSGKWSSDSGKGNESIAEYRFLRTDGTIVWVMGRAVPEIENNSIIGYVGTITDITERKISEDKLKSSEERLKIIYENAPDAYYLNDLKGKILDGNLAAERLLGFKRDELIGQNLLKLDLISAKDLPKAAGVLVKNSLGHSTGPDIFTLKRKDGSKTAVEVITHPVKIESQTLVLGIARDISERIRSHEALIESETKYRQLVTQSPDGIFIADLTGKFLSVNRTICKNLGFTEEEMLSMSLLNIVPEKYHATHKERLASLIQSKKDTALSAEYEVVGKDGISHYVEVLSVPYYRDKTIIGFQGIARDITERMKMETLLRESEEKYRLIFENIQDLYYETSIEGMILEVSPSIEVISKGSYKRDDLLGKSIYDFYTQSDERNTLFSELLKKGYVTDFEISLKNRDGSVVPCAISAKVISVEGVPQKIVGSMHDITDRRNSLNILKESEARFRSYFETSLAGIAITTPDTAWIDVNKTLSEMLGYSKEELLKTKWTDITHPDDLNIDLKEFERVIKGESEGYFLDKRFICKDKTIIWTSLAVRCVRNIDGSVKYLISLIIDITERKRTETELIKAKEKAEESDRLKTAFLNNISHEIRTPMNAITGFCALLNEPGIDEQMRTSFIETITQSSDQLLNIIYDILEVSNIDAGIIKITKTEVDINPVLKNLFTQFSPKADERGIKLNYSLTLNDNDAKILTDKTKLIQILSNLLNNAFKFTQKGQIEFGYKIVAGNFQFHVSDSGIGIPEDKIDKIFDRFYQIDHGLDRQFEGTGLGLSICKAYVSHLGGDIWVTSATGTGSTFYFTIPVAKPARSAMSDKPLSSEINLLFSRKKTILVAEDVESNYILILNYLKETNSVVLWAKNGQEAVEKAISDKNIDLILMDIRMPVMDGYEATQRIREAGITVPVLAQTAYADDFVKAIEAGCTGMISKPFDKYKLLSTIEDMIK